MTITRLVWLKYAKTHSFLGEHWQNSWVNMCFFLFHPTSWPTAAEKHQIHNYQYALPTVAFLLSIGWGQGRGHASVIENSLDRLNSAHVITQVRTCPQGGESLFQCHHSAVQIHRMLSMGADHAGLFVLQRQINKWCCLWKTTKQRCHCDWHRLLISMSFQLMIKLYLLF